jgi:hypothetical protein
MSLRFYGLAFLLFLCLSAFSQNTLNNLGLTSSTPAALAYSVRQLSSGYTGPALRLRRTTDNQVVDVYFDGSGNISLNSQVSAAGGGAATGTLLSTWIGSNSATVATWYDQSGNGYHATQATTGRQPSFISAGAINTQNGRPTLVFSGGQTLQSAANATQISTSGNITTSNFVFQTNTISSYFWSNGDPGSNRYNIHAPWGTGLTYFDVGDIGSGGRMYGVQTWRSYSIGTFIRNGSQGDVYRNGQGCISNSLLSTSVTSTANMWIGSNGGAGGFITGSVAELTSFVTALSTADRTTVENNQSTYYSVGLITASVKTLDKIGLTAATPAAVAYSLRLLSSGYAGPAVQVSRSSDNEMRDVYFDGSGTVSLNSAVSAAGGGPATATTLGSWIGSNSGTVSIWYDQSGNARNAQQFNLTQQPTLISAGVINTENGKPALLFSGGQNMESIATGTQISTSGNISSTNVVYKTTTANTSIWSNAGPGINRYNIHGPWSDGNTYFDVGDITSGGRYYGALSWTGYSIGTFRRNGAQADVWKNGVNSLSSSTLSTTMTNTANMWLGSFDIGSSYINGAVGELLSFNTALSTADRTALECSQSNYYTIAASEGSVEFYVQETAGAASCFVGEEQVVWQLNSLSNLLVSGNNLTKNQSGGWNGGAASWNTVANNGYLQFTASETSTARMIGLSNTFTSSSYTTIQYALYLTNSGGLQIYESGSYKGTYGTYNTNDVFKIAVENSVVKYYQNGTLLYTSIITPTLPLLADVSINSNGGTVTNAVIGNLYSGTFTANTVNTGTANYQWVLNGSNVGSNSATYTNTSLSLNDVLYCTINYTGACGAATATSNTITIRQANLSPLLNVYATGTATTSGCNYAVEQVTWQSSTLYGLQATGNNLSKFSYLNGWNTGAASYNTVSDNGYFQFTATETNTSRMAGLSSSYTTPSYTGIQYAIYLITGGNLQIYEAGSYKASVGTYTTGDIFKVAVEFGNVNYYQNGNLLYTSQVAPTLPLLVNVAINTANGTITNALVANPNTGGFSVSASNLGSSPTYQWIVNGSNVGSNTPTYTNSSLSNNDVVTCQVTPSVIGCTSSNTVLSNSITNQLSTAPSSVILTIAGVQASSACTNAIEQVVWQATTLSNLKATGNSLLKIQSNGNWNGGAASYNTVANNGYFQFTATEVTASRMAGLSNAFTSSSYTTIQYAFYLRNDGALFIYESGSGRGQFGTYATNDVFKISVENSLVKYYQNGTLLYISGVAPTLPMLVDVSINNQGGTITNALVGNTNTGAYTAAVTNAGTSPTYAWFLNGSGVGTNSPSYTNPSPANNDVVTCKLYPDWPGCTTASSITSNTITEQNASTNTSIDFYVQGTVAATGCNTVTEQVVWQKATLTNLQANGNSLTKIQNGGWNGGAASFNTVSNNGYFQFTASETNSSRMAGLSSSYTSPSYTTIQYAFYLVNSGALQIYESGVYTGSFGTYSVNDVFKIAVEQNVVKYYQNGNLLYISATAPTLPLLVDVSINSVGGTITNALVSNYNTGVFTATATNSGAAPTYQWFLNGSPAGTNSITYTNTSLANNDVITCQVTPNLSGCTSANLLTSNTVTNQVVTSPLGMDFYIQGSVAASACNTDAEQVVWQISSLSNVKATGNNLTKIQSNGNWNGGAASFNTVSNNGYFQFTASETNTSRMAGLSNSYTSSSYTTIQYALYLRNDGALFIYESGNSRGQFGTYATNDIMKISVESNTVKYYQNGNLLYTSTVAPTLPLLVDASINSQNGTITNTLVSNYTTGTFTATATNAGTAPSYQWYLNGGTVGANSNTYSNTSLNNNDILICRLTPDLGGCSTLTPVASNSITNISLNSPTSMSFYISGVSATAACNNSLEQVSWQSSTLANQQASGNSLTKAPVNGWNGGAASFNTVSNYGYFQFTASETTTSRMAGLSTSYTGAGYIPIQYAFYLVNTGALQIYESGNGRGTFGTYSTGDILKIAVENNVVKYYQNGNLLYISGTTPTLPLLVDVAINTAGGTVNNCIVVNYNTGLFTATATNAGAPTYQWYLNGATVGTNSSTYTNTSLSNNDIVTCTITPSLAGCSSVNNLSSNSITNNSITTGNNIGFYVESAAVTSACNLGQEQVVWQTSTLTNVTTSSNNITKFQSNGSWNGAGASWNVVNDNGYFQFTASETNTARMAGLSTSFTSTSYTTIQYAFYLTNTAGLQIYESGTFRTTVGTYAVNDVFKIAVENSVVKYYQNNNLVYISAVTPTLPLLVDVSINNTGGTITNALVFNLNTGTFNATAVNAGVTPTYQWYLNSIAVGSNSPVYTNTSLSNNDIITCNLIPNIGGCSTTNPVSSNRLTNLNTSTSNNINFYVQGSAVVSGCNTDLEQVVWQGSTLSNVKASGNNLTKIQSGGNWNGGAASYNTVANNGYFQFTASETNTSRMVGLSTSFTSSSYTTIQYAFYLINTGNLQIYESGTARGSFGTYATNDILKITVENNVVKYYQNGNLLYISSVTPTLPMLVDASINTLNGTITNAMVANYNTGVFTATAINAGSTPAYQWYLNGTTVGTNSASYSNTSLNNNDIVTCVLTPNLGGCSASTTLTSNTVTNQSVTNPVGISLYMLGATASGTCKEAVEQVVWQSSTLTNVSASGNNLIKIQSNGNWNGGAASYNTVANYGYFQFTATETNTYRAIGLSTSFTSSSYTTIQYAFYLTNTGSLQIMESGTSRGTFGTYSTNDVLKIAVENNIVKYYQNGATLYVSGVTPTLPLLVNASLYNTNATITNALVVNNTSAGLFNVTTTNAGASPTFSFFVNGSQVQTGTSSSYTNTALATGDLVICKLTPNLGGCSASIYNSNSISINNPGATNTWTGNVNSNWNNTGNWSSGLIPDRFTVVTIPAGTTNSLALANDASAYDFNVNSSASFAINTTNRLSVYRNFTNNGSFTQNSSTVSMLGCNASGIISSSSSETFYNLQVNNSNGITISSGTHQVSNIMTLTNGIITQNGTLRMLVGSSVTGASATSYVNGPIQKAGTTAFIFPTGSAIRYAPIAIGVPTASTTYTAQYFSSSFGTYTMASTPTPALSNVSDIEYWSLNQTVGSGNATVTLYWQDSKYSRIANCGTTDLRVARFNGTAWENNNNSVSTTGSCSLTSSLSGTISTTAAVTKFGFITFGSLTGANPLPVELVEFKGTSLETSIQLEWQTASEINSDHFELQRMNSDKSFTTIGFVKGAGTTTQARYYQFEDKSPYSGRNYYRLKSVDFDGSFDYSETISVNFTGNTPVFQFSFYPNPTDWLNAKIILKSNISSAPLELELFSLTGELLHKRSFLNSGEEQSLFSSDPGLSAGLYILSVTQGDHKETVKIVLLKQ